jgi:hypothetical protein
MEIKTSNYPTPEINSCITTAVENSPLLFLL